LFNHEGSPFSILAETEESKQQVVF